MTSIDDRFGPDAALLLRLGLGVMWISHALLKWFVFTIPGFSTWLGTQGIPVFMAYPVFLFELIGGIMILIGFYGRYVSAVLMPVMFVAAWTHFPNGWLFTNEGGGWEYPIFLLLASTVHILLGDGRFAIRTRQNLLTTK
ncbi:MAG: DoxX family protein [Gammaproteobacteria bacterium]|nr:DoxX family protein [Gammaproteobacteria bacterium]